MERTGRSSSAGLLPAQHGASPSPPAQQVCAGHGRSELKCVPLKAQMLNPGAPVSQDVVVFGDIALKEISMLKKKPWG